MLMEKAFLTQYCDLAFEWYSTGINIDIATKSQQIQMKKLQTQAIEQSGLTLNELALISMCRKYGIFVKVNTYAHRIKAL